MASVRFDASRDEVVAMLYLNTLGYAEAREVRTVVRCGRWFGFSLPATYAMLSRLQDRGWVDRRELPDRAGTRGGCRRFIWRLTDEGRAALSEAFYSRTLAAAMQLGA